MPSCHPHTHTWHPGPPTADGFAYFAARGDAYCCGLLDLSYAPAASLTFDLGPPSLSVSLALSVYPSPSLAGLLTVDYIAARDFDLIFK